VDAVLVSVVDEGVGIPDDELNAVFDKFVQSSKTKTGSGGTGLGLAICREIVEAHGGKIWAENNATGGATFHFTLAASQAALATVLDEPYRVGSEPLNRNEATKK
jgi:signal transduction histidine kinase